VERDEKTLPGRQYVCESDDVMKNGKQLKVMPCCKVKHSKMLQGAISDFQQIL